MYTKRKNSYQKRKAGVNPGLSSLRYMRLEIHAFFFPGDIRVRKQNGYFFPGDIRFTNKTGHVFELFCESLLEVACYSRVVCDDHKSVRIYAGDDLAEVGLFILGDDRNDDMGVFSCVCSDAFPSGGSAVQFIQYGIREAFFLREDHAFYLDVLSVDSVDKDACYNREYDRVEDSRYVIHEQADRVYA